MFKLQIMWESASKSDSKSSESEYIAERVLSNLSGSTAIPGENISRTNGKEVTTISYFLIFLNYKLTIKFIINILMFFPFIQILVLGANLIINLYNSFE